MPLKELCDIDEVGSLCNDAKSVDVVSDCHGLWDLVTYVSNAGKEQLSSLFRMGKVRAWSCSPDREILTKFRIFPCGKVSWTVLVIYWLAVCGLFMSLVSGVVFWDKCQRQSFASITVPDVLNSKNAEAKCCLSATTVTYHVVLGVVVRFWMRLSHECRGQATRLLCIYPRDASTVLVEHSMTSCCVTARAIQLTAGVFPSVLVRTNGKASHCVAMQQSKKHQLIRKPIGCSKSKKPQFSGCELLASVQP